MDYLDDYDEPGLIGRLIGTIITYSSLAILGALSLLMGGIVVIVILLTLGSLSHPVP